MKFTMFFLILIVLFLSGCVEQEQTQGLDIKMMADSESVFAGSETRVYLDVNNNDVKSIKNVEMDIFDTGTFTKEDCEKKVGEIKPGSFEILECRLRAPSTIPTSPFTATVSARVQFDSKLSAVQIVEMITKAEYDIREKTGKLVKMPKTYSYKDSNLELQIDFSDELPIVVRDKKVYMYLTIRNIGNGFVSDIGKNDIDIDEEGGVVNCVKQNISPIGKEFPRIACELDMPKDINYLSNYVIILNIDYNYELREELPIDIVR